MSSCDQWRLRTCRSTSAIVVALGFLCSPRAAVADDDGLRDVTPPACNDFCRTWMGLNPSQPANVTSSVPGVSPTNPVEAVPPPEGIRKVRKSPPTEAKPIRRGPSALGIASPLVPLPPQMPPGLLSTGTPADSVARQRQPSITPDPSITKLLPPPVQLEDTSSIKVPLIVPEPPPPAAQVEGPEAEAPRRSAVTNLPTPPEPTRPEMPALTAETDATGTVPPNEKISLSVAPQVPAKTSADGNRLPGATTLPVKLGFYFVLTLIVVSMFRSPRRSLVDPERQSPVPSQNPYEF